MLALLACVLTLCSDDMLGVLGNERLTWSPSEGATYYVVSVWDFPTPGAEPVFRPCASTNAPALELAPTDCYGDRLIVDACKPDPAGGPDLCSGPNTAAPVEVLPFACLQTVGCSYSDDGDARNDSCTVCETPCFAGAARRLGNVPLC